MHDGEFTKRSASSTPTSKHTPRSRWMDEDGGSIVRSSTQVPFLTRDALARLLGLRRRACA